MDIVPANIASIANDCLAAILSCADRRTAYIAANVAKKWRSMLDPRLCLKWYDVVSHAHSANYTDNFTSQMRLWCKEIPWNVDIRLLAMKFRTMLFVENPWVAFCNGVATAVEIADEVRDSDIFPDILILKDHPSCFNVLRAFYPDSTIGYWYCRYHTPTDGRCGKSIRWLTFSNPPAKYIVHCIDGFWYCDEYYP